MTLTKKNIINSGWRAALALVGVAVAVEERAFMRSWRWSWETAGPILILVAFTLPLILLCFSHLRRMWSTLPSGNPT